jgi:hemerythrin-like domain-containing protein
MTRTRLEQIADSIKRHIDERDRLAAGELTPEVSEQVDHLNSRIRALEEEREKIEAGEKTDEPLRGPMESRDDTRPSTPG